MENIIQKCASKTCSECDGPYESDCIKCIPNYYQDSNSKMCLMLSTSYFLQLSSIYQVCSFISFIIILIHILLSLRYGNSVTDLVLHSQAFILMVVSAQNINYKLIEYISWMQFFKFDFSFINDLLGYRRIECTPSSNKLLLLRINCEETLINFQNLIFITILVIILKIMIKYTHFMLKIFSWLFIYWQNSTMNWLLIFVFFPFICINLRFEFESFSSHIILSLFSVLLIMILFFKKMHFLKTKYVKLIDPFNSISYCYLMLVIRILYVLLFMFESKLISLMLMILILIAQITILFSQINNSTKLPKHRVFSKAAGIFGNTVIILITMLLMIDRMIGSSYQNENPNKESTTEIICVLLMTTMLICYSLITICMVISECF